MMLLSSSPSETIERALTFARDIFGAQSAAYYRVDAKLCPFDYALRDVPADFHQRYLETMDPHDPVHVRRLVAQSTTIGQLDPRGASADEALYKTFLNHFGLSASVELVFLKDGRAHGGMCMMWKDEPPAGEVLRIAQSVRDYLEYTLRPPASSIDRYGLTAREREVSQLLCCGRTNIEIADLMGIGIATVKTHLIHLYTKLGVETRAAAVGLLSRAA